MIQALPKPLTFEEVVAWLPENGRYELIDGIVIEMQPTGTHEEVTEFISTALTLEANRLQLPYRFPRMRTREPAKKSESLPLDVGLFSWVHGRKRRCENSWKQQLNTRFAILKA